MKFVPTSSKSRAAHLHQLRIDSACDQGESSPPKGILRAATMLALSVSTAALVAPRLDFGMTHAARMAALERSPATCVPAVAPCRPRAELVTMAAPLSETSEPFPITRYSSQDWWRVLKELPSSAVLVRIAPRMAANGGPPLVLCVQIARASRRLRHQHLEALLEHRRERQHRLQVDVGVHAAVAVQLRRAPEVGLDRAVADRLEQARVALAPRRAQVREAVGVGRGRRRRAPTRERPRCLRPRRPRGPTRRLPSRLFCRKKEALFLREKYGIHFLPKVFVKSIFLMNF